MWSYRTNSGTANRGEITFSLAAAAYGKQAVKRDPLLGVVVIIGGLMLGHYIDQEVSSAARTVVPFFICPFLASSHPRHKRSPKRELRFQADEFSSRKRCRDVAADV